MHSFKCRTLLMAQQACQESIKHALKNTQRTKHLRKIHFHFSKAGFLCICITSWHTALPHFATKPNYNK